MIELSATSILYPNRARTEFVRNTVSTPVTTIERIQGIAVGPFPEFIGRLGSPACYTAR